MAKCEDCNYKLEKSYYDDSKYECPICGQTYTTKKKSRDDDLLGDVLGLGIGLILGGLGGGSSSSSSDSDSSSDWSGGGGDSAGGGASDDW